MPFARRLPLPTISRDVSGSERAIAIRQLPEHAARNQKIALHPSVAFRTAPKTGPRLGAVFVLLELVRIDAIDRLTLPKCKNASE